ncbi:FAD-binding and (Fe-S)-binding domain-containing protein [Rufibacter latericius]|uniref:FAD-binding oxidoreductase n=1 Tax=Rufibacter latericius TaxID=2487040 RepID=A0A3M9N1S8_9BACT|nr:FAD-binding and (Fe-S)-binding domain-containing protein [Rufibacter latericius]RNI31676.1 FAD-binding oxidoreductase [Rufibacter latericius]
MTAAPSFSAFAELEASFTGELFYDAGSSLHEAQRRVYATDASVYQEKPVAVAIPKTKEDLKALIRFANQHQITLIPRAAGTSLAGQVVGNGLVVDISKYFTQILEINDAEQWVRVQPGVIRDDLNATLRPHGLLFGPETSTASRAMVGGMIGNNSCGLHSIVWGDTRTHLLSAKVLLSDGSEAEFKPLTHQELQQKLTLQNLEGEIYRKMYGLISAPENRALIQQNYPKKTLTRRNTGYALDFLVDEGAGAEGQTTLDLCKLLAGSEGTLAFVTEAKLNLIPLPPKEEGLVCVHFNSLMEALEANIIILKHQPMSSELVDKYIMDFTKGHRTYDANRFFIEGDPAALLMVEFMADSQDIITDKAEALIADLKAAGLGYAYPVVRGALTKPVWDVRKAGLGLIRNLPGDTQPVNLIEDCAVSPEDLPAYITDLQKVLEKHNLQASYYAHAGAGELHVEPMINLKTNEGKQVFRQVLAETTELVKKYNGSLSGEHGDGRLRGEFIPQALGQEVYQLLKEVKSIFDPKHIFNAGKIVDTPPMNEFLRYEEKPAQQVIPVETLFDFSQQEGILRMAEKCSGSGDCRKTHVSGGTMCPSYMATRQEKDTTRARANILRQFLTNSDKLNKFDHKEIKEVMDLCLSCKACKSECPSSVDVAKMKAEFLQHYHDANGVPLRTRMIGNFTKMQQLASVVPGVYNFMISNPVTSKLIKKTVGFAPERSLPEVGKTTLRSWFKKWQKENAGSTQNGRPVYLFCDEFTNYNDVEIGQTTVKLLTALGYSVQIPEHLESGRTYLSKGLVREAKEIAIKNVQLLSQAMANGTPIIGIEPSAILTLRDEYLDLVLTDLVPAARQVADNSFLLEEFLLKEVENGNITPAAFTQEKKQIKLHGHCYQKALQVLTPTQKILSLPQHYEVEMIPSGCCGMAGSFGYEEEHYGVSMQIGELVLFPAVRNAAPEVIIAAAGTSCRHQIKDGTARKALHPAEILWQALKK